MADQALAGAVVQSVQHPAPGDGTMKVMLTFVWNTFMRIKMRMRIVGKIRNRAMLVYKT